MQAGLYRRAGTPAGALRGLTGFDRVCPGFPGFARGLLGSELSWGAGFGAGFRAQCTNPSKPWDPEEAGLPTDRV